MTVDEVTRLITAITGVLGVVVWPALILFLAIRFRTSLADFFAHLGEFSFKAPGLEATARRQQVEAAAALGAAVAARGEGDADAPTRVSGVARTLTEAVPDARSQSRLQGRLVLWVDDYPDNNRYERQALEALGIRFTLSTSTDEALEQLRRRPFDLIISDVGRGTDPRAGYTLLDKVRADGDLIPFIIYSTSRAPEHILEARRHGATACTNAPQELIQMVIEILRRAA